jgi:hypothetical protein
MKYLIAMVMLLWIGVPFSPIWRGGAFDRTLAFSKVVPIALLIGIVANDLARLKRLIFVQTASVIMVVVLTLVKYRFHASEDHRLTGAIIGLYGNPNDLALAITLVFPYCIMFMLFTKNVIKQAAWALSLLLSGFALLLTYSRGALLAVVVSGCVLLWEFGVKGKRYGLLAAAGFATLCLLVAGPKGYMNRVISIVHPSADDRQSGEESWQARKELLLLSLSLTAQHPLLGIGAGNFGPASGHWLLSHNTYTELSAEGGVFVLLLYILIMVRTYKNIQETQRYCRGEPELMLLSGALKVSLAAYLVGSFFDSVAYYFFPYFLVAYSGALLTIAKAKTNSQLGVEQVNDEPRNLKGQSLSGVMGHRDRLYGESGPYGLLPKP